MIIRDYSTPNIRGISGIRGEIYGAHPTKSVAGSNQNTNDIWRIVI